MPYATLDLCPQETRRIVSAEFQHVTYDEWLPLVLDGATMSQYRLTEGTFEYDPNLNPTVSNVFSTAVFRFGHSQIKQTVKVTGTQCVYYVTQTVNEMTCIIYLLVT